MTPEGLACQFVPVGFFTVDQFQSVVRTFLVVFPHSTLWFNKYGECILIGNASGQPKLSKGRRALLLCDKGLRADLNYSFYGEPWLVMNLKEVLAANYRMGPERLANVAAEATLYRDDCPVLEYGAARNTYAPIRLHQLLEKNLDSPEGIFAEEIPIALEARILRIREEAVHEASR